MQVGVVSNVGVGVVIAVVRVIDFIVLIPLMREVDVCTVVEVFDVVVGMIVEVLDMVTTILGELMVDSGTISYNKKTTIYLNRINFFSTITDALFSVFMIKQIIECLY